MKYIIKDDIIVLIYKKKKYRIILNFNNDKNSMSFKTLLSIKKIVDTNINDKCFIININRYSNSADDIISKLSIKKPKIEIFSINTYKYIDSIKNKMIFDIDEIDRMIIIFTSNKIEEILNYIKTLNNFEKIIFSILK